jgi:hypothetical protein
MVGFPKNLLTKQDYLNAVTFANSSGEGKNVILSALNGLKINNKINVLKKASAGKPADEQTLEDYEAIVDPNCEMIRLGFTIEEIDNLIRGLN